MKSLTMCIQKIASKGRLLVFAAAVVVSIAPIVASGGAVHADFVASLCASGGQACLNAWNGGPAVKVYQPSQSPNSGFEWITAADSRYVNVLYTNNLGNPLCVGDLNNDPGDAHAGLVNCGAGALGWGANFEKWPCVDSRGISGVSFRSAHWSNGSNGAWLGPNGTTNGSWFFNNKPSQYCFT